MLRFKNNLFSGIRKLQLQERATTKETDVRNLRGCSIPESSPALPPTLNWSLHSLIILQILLIYLILMQFLFLRFVCTTENP